METKKQKLHYGYVVVAGVILLGLIQGMVINTVSLFYTPVSNELGISLSTFGWFATITTLSTAFLMSPAGAFFKKLDTKASLTICVLIYVVSNLVRAFTHSIFVFYITGAVQGFASAVFIFMMVPVLVQNWFAVKQGTMIGICAATQGLGASLFSAIGGVIIQNMSWRTCYLVWAAVALIIGLPISLFVVKKDPAEMGLLPIGYDKQPVNEEKPSEETALSGMDAKDARKTMAFVLLALFAGLYGFGNVFNGYVNSYITTIGYSASVAGTVSSMVMLGMTIGKIVNGFICDKSLKGDIILCSISSILAFPIFILVKDKSVVMIIIAALMFGWTYSSLNVIAPVLTKQLFGQKDFIGIWANIGTVENLIGAFGYTAWGWVIAATNFNVTMIIVSVLYFVVMTCGLLAIAQSKKLSDKWK